MNKIINKKVVCAFLYKHIKITEQALTCLLQYKLYAQNVLVICLYDVVKDNQIQKSYFSE